MRTRHGLICLIVALSFGATRTAAQSVEGRHALAIAAGVGWHSPDLTPAQKAALINLSRGKPSLLGQGGELTVTADAVVCRHSDITGDDSCDLTFGMNDVAFGGRRARTLFDDLGAAGVVSDGAAGSINRAISALSCVVGKDRKRVHCLYKSH